MAPDLEPLRNRLREAKLRLDFAYNYLHELETDPIVGPDFDEALTRALRAVAEAKLEYTDMLKRFSDGLNRRSTARGA